ncbi:MAG: hypothetical protein JXO72_02460 [Vicinamibacteria bacterium]|nr:hypothetical protein [Vicinamibacteria bacterium]
MNAVAQANVSRPESPRDKREYRAAMSSGAGTLSMKNRPVSWPPKAARLTAYVAVAIMASAFPIPAQDVLQQPPGIEWKKIDTPHFEVVFPKEITHEGQRVANALEHLHAPLGKTMPRKSRRISVFLMNQLVDANGYVSSMPRYSAFFGTPPQGAFGGLTDWYLFLAAHEGRHVVQGDKLNRGFTWLAGRLFGDAGRAGFSYLSTPLWFWEGDAVAAETTLTRGGRGRQPSFDLELRAPLVAGRRFSYYKHYFGSYRDRTANAYGLGYPLVTRVRRERGSLAWSRIADRVSRWSFWPFAFHEALRKEYGKGPVGLYEDAMRELASCWKAQLETLDVTPFRKLNPDAGRTFTAYLFPEYDEDGSVVVQKYGFDQPTTLVRLGPDGREKRIVRFRPAEIMGTRGSLGGGKVAWNEIVPDVRWGYRNYSVVAIHDLARGGTRRLTRRTKLLNPAMSPDGRRVAAVEFTPERACAIVVLDVETGREMERFPNPQNDTLVAPSWSEDATRLVFTRQGRNGRALTIAEPGTGAIEDVVPPGWEDITNPAIHGRYVFFNSPYSGIDNIHAIDMESSRRYMVTSSRMGAYFPRVSADGRKLLYSEYTLAGHDVVETELDPRTWRPIEEIEDRNVRYFEPLVAQEQGGSLFGEGRPLPAIEYPVRTYRPLAHVLNVHSWALSHDAPEISVALLSQDKLNMMSLMTGLLYDRDERASKGFIQGTYKGLFPLLDFRVSHGGHKTKLAGDEGADGVMRETIDYWRETEMSGGLRLPFNLSRGVDAMHLEVGAQAAWTKIVGRYAADHLAGGNGDRARVGYHARFARIRDGARRDVRPIWGQTARISYSHTPLGGDDHGALLSLSAECYLPGIRRHHAVTLSGGVETQRPNDYRFDSALGFPRGFDSRFHRRFARASADYALPVADPDLALGPFLYLKRITGNVFFDYGLGAGERFTCRYRSLGAEVFFESHVLSLHFPVQLGARYIYRIDRQSNTVRTRNSVEPILGLSF